MEVILHLFQHMSAFKQAAAQYDKETTCPKIKMNSTGAAHVKGFGCHLAYQRAHQHACGDLDFEIALLSLSVLTPSL